VTGATRDWDQIIMFDRNFAPTFTTTGGGSCLQNQMKLANEHGSHQVSASQFIFYVFDNKLIATF
jgi:hypothetical protein